MLIHIRDEENDFVMPLTNSKTGMRQNVKLSINSSFRSENSSNIGLSEHEYMANGVKIKNLTGHIVSPNSRRQMINAISDKVIQLSNDNQN